MRSTLATKTSTHQPAPIGLGRPVKAANPAAKAAPKTGDLYEKKSGPLALQIPGSTIAAGDLEGLAKNLHVDPHTVLGAHDVMAGAQKATAVRALFPDRDQVTLVVRDPSGAPKTVPMKKVHDAGIFEAVLPRQKKLSYQFQLTAEDGTLSRVEDPYRFPVTVNPMDTWLFNEGSLEDVAGLLGSHQKTIDGVQGFNFVVWAPNAKRVSIAGEWNGFDGRQQPARRLGDSGLWEIFVPGVKGGQKYELELHGADGKITKRADPAARAFEVRPGTRSVTAADSKHTWSDASWMKARATGNPLEKPMATYEVHLPSWKKPAAGEFMNYRELADELVPYLKEKGFTHVELMGLLEHPLDDSWGYQVTGYFAPTSRHGSPEDFKYFVDKLHQAGVGIIMDWVPAHFPKNTDAGLAGFDGTHLFDHADPKQGEHKDWGTQIFNYGRNEVKAFLTGSLMHLLKEYHLDGVRVDAVASMLYLDYSRKDGEWVPNKNGGNENLEAIEFMKHFNAKIDAKLPGVLSIAEESTAWPGVTKKGGEKDLGFDLKWNMGWMNDTLDWFHTPTEYRGKDLDKLTNTFLWTHAENYVVALSHDEVVYGKGSLLDKMPGDEWQKFANLRLLLGYMWSYPGQKLLFMGGEFGQKKEWNFKEGLDWDALKHGPKEQGVANLMADLNRLYAEEPALHEKQFDPAGMELVFRDTTNAAVGILRKGKSSKDDVMFVHNLTEQPREKYRIGVDSPGKYGEIFNSDSEYYGGSNLGNLGAVKAEPVPYHGKPYSIEVTLPPLAAVAFKRLSK